MLKVPRQSHKNICLQEKQNWSAQVSCSCIQQVICKSAYGCVGVIAHYGNVFLNMEYAIPKHMKYNLLHPSSVQHLSEHTN